MKKVFLGMITIIIGLGILSTFYINKKPTMPMPEYPLELSIVDAAFEEWNPWGANYIINVLEPVKHIELSIKHFDYVIYNTEEDRWPLMSITSGQLDGEYLLNMGFMPSTTDYSISMEDSEGAIVFATKLFGNFESVHSIYDKFISDYKKGRNIISEEQLFPADSTERQSERISMWERTINGIDCKIRFEQRFLDNPETSIRDIWISTDFDTFYSQRN